MHVWPPVGPSNLKWMAFFNRLLTQFSILVYPHDMTGSNPDPQIDGVLPQDRARTLELVFGHLRSDDRQRQIGEALAHVSPLDSAPLEGLMGARRNGRLVGAMFSQIEPGKTAMVWLPRLTVGEPESTAAGLFAATWNFLTRQRVVLAQILLPMVDKVQRTMLRLGGVRHLADLLYLVSPINCQTSLNRWGRHFCLPRVGKNTCPTIAAKSPLDFEPYCVANHNRLAQIIEATYEGTFDCPGLQGVRNPEDVLAGYRSTGVFDPRHWLIVRHDRRDVGCLLLADHPRLDNMELLYLGLIPAARGHGWGKQLAGRAQWLARLAGRRRLVLAVDAANAPAVRTYTAMDFQAWQRRQLYVKRLRFNITDNWHASFQQVIHAGRRPRAKNFAPARTPS